MKFTKPIAEQNMTIPTFQAFLEAKKIADISIGSGSEINVDKNSNYYLVIKALTGKFYLLPMSAITTSSSYKLFSMSVNDHYVQIWQHTNGHIVVRGYSSANTVVNLYNAVDQMYAIDPAKEV